MRTIKFDIDKTENRYIHFNGNTLEELKSFIYPNGKFEDCCGMIICKQNDSEVRMSIAAVKEYGVYIGFFDGKQEYLSLSDKEKLSNVVDVWGDDLYVSEGLFISPQLAWRCICRVIEAGNIDREMDWITPNELPEDGNYI